MRAILLLYILLGISVLASAKTSINSMCYMLNQGSNIKVEGEKADELFEIASVSKVATAYWAIRTLTPYYRFKTRIFITPLGGDTFDVHIQGSQDPFWGRQLTHFLFAELTRHGVRQIRKLTFDENLVFRWLVISDHIDPKIPTPQEIADSLIRHIQNLSSEYPRTRQEASLLGIKLPRTLSLKVQSVEYLPQASFLPATDTRIYVLKSVPLYRYLKEMNIVSNNHVADHLFNFLGGPAKFQSFIQSDMNMDTSDIQFVNGSGNSHVVGTDSNGQPIKEYNKASCDTMIRIIYRMQTELQKNFKLSLKDVMAVSGADKGTLSPRYDSLPNSIVAKTGTVDPAVTLAGAISTGQGEVYFGIFMSTESPADWNNARDKVRDRVMDLIKRYRGRKTFKYTFQEFLPFDHNSTMIAEVKTVSSLP